MLDAVGTIDLAAAHFNTPLKSVSPQAGTGMDSQRYIGHGCNGLNQRKIDIGFTVIDTIGCANGLSQYINTCLIYILHAAVRISQMGVLLIDEYIMLNT